MFKAGGVGTLSYEHHNIAEPAILYVDVPFPLRYKADRYQPRGLVHDGYCGKDIDLVRDDDNMIND